MNAADISVVMPVYNEEENIADVIDRVRETVGADAEVIVVDDASTDGTSDLVERELNLVSSTQ